jgi:hypothetical protein
MISWRHRNEDADHWKNFIDRQNIFILHFYFVAHRTRKIRRKTKICQKNLSKDNDGSLQTLDPTGRCDPSRRHHMWSDQQEFLRAVV